MSSNHKDKSEIKKKTNVGKFTYIRIVINKNISNLQVKEKISKKIENTLKDSITLSERQI